jgi:hypothetical protein
VPDTSFFYCERCGTATFLRGTTLDAHYCPGCRRYTCHDCWTVAAHRCARCAIEAAKPAKGITVARTMLGTLRSIRHEMAAITAREAKGAEPGAELEIERRLLGVKSASLAVAIERALADPPAHHAVTAGSLRRAAQVEVERIPRALAVPAEPSRQPPPTRNWLVVLRSLRVPRSARRLVSWIPRRSTSGALPKIDLGRLRTAALVFVVVSSVAVLLVTRLAATIGVSRLARRRSPRDRWRAGFPRRALSRLRPTPAAHRPQRRCR